MPNPQIKNKKNIIKLKRIRTIIKFNVFDGEKTPVKEGMNTFYNYFSYSSSGTNSVLYYHTVLTQEIIPNEKKVVFYTYKQKYNSNVLQLGSG